MNELNEKCSRFFVNFPIMDECGPYKSEREYGYSKRHFRRLVKKITETECEELVRKIEKENSKNAKRSTFTGIANKNHDR